MNSTRITSQCVSTRIPGLILRELAIITQARISLRTTNVTQSEPKITPELVAAHGLKPDEYARLLALIGRAPTFTELGIFSAMWNEDCSYQYWRLQLRAHPNQAP